MTICQKHNKQLLVKSFGPKTETARHGTVQLYCPSCEKESKIKRILLATAIFGTIIITTIIAVL